jgi:hypothetical protein
MRSIISKILTILIVFAFLQIPFFMMQYRHHLEGHFKELEIYREELMKSASKSNLSLESYVLHFENNPDPIVGSQGHVGVNITLESLCYMIIGFLISLLVSNPFKKRTKNGHV